MLGLFSDFPRRWQKRYRRFKKFEAIEASREGLNCLQILEGDYGHRESCRQKACVDREGQPVPWYTYPAIEYLSQLDFSQKRVFEFGSGNSTLFWSALAGEVVSVEDNREWFEQVSTKKRPNMDLRFAANRDEYLGALDGASTGYDLVIVDGSHRPACAEVAVRKLNGGGMIILDNADWHPQVAAFLRSQDLLEVDMTGFGPINGYTWTTSLFFHRAFRLEPRSGRQPQYGVGSIHQLGEDQH